MSRRKPRPINVEERAEAMHQVALLEDALDTLWEYLSDCCCRDLQAERDACRDAIDAMIDAAWSDK